MNHKEKAKELVDKYEKLLDYELIPINDKDCSYQAKQCALICVDEKIQMLEKICEIPILGAFANKICKNEILKLKKVKQEIEKL